MAVRKETVKRQFSEAFPAVLEPGERVITGTLAQSGPTPWLAGAIGILIMVLAGMRIYFLAVTDRRVLFMRASMLTSRPKGLAWADPRGAATVADVVADAKLWNHFVYLRPGQKRLRLNVHRFWRDELKEVLEALSIPTPGAAAPPPPPPPAAP